MVALAPHLAAMGRAAVDGPSAANGETGKAASECLRSVGSNDEMNVVDLHGELDQPK